MPVGASRVCTATAEGERSDDTAGGIDDWRDKPLLVDIDCCERMAFVVVAGGDCSGCCGCEGGREDRRRCCEDDDAAERPDGEGLSEDSDARRPTPPERGEGDRLPLTVVPGRADGDTDMDGCKNDDEATLAVDDCFSSCR